MVLFLHSSSFLVSKADPCSLHALSYLDCAPLGAKVLTRLLFYHLVCLWQGWGSCFCSLVMNVFVVWDIDCCKNYTLFCLSSSTDGVTTAVLWAFVLLGIEMISKV